MSKRDDYERKTELLLEPLMKENNFELVDVEYVKEGGNWILRAYIDKEGGITINDCELVNRALSDILDDNSYIEDSYILEVSSPGLGRQLKKEKDYKRSIGEDIEIKLYKAMPLIENGKKISVKELLGTLIGFDEEKITIEIDGKTHDIVRKDIAMIRLALDF